MAQAATKKSCTPGVGEKAPAFSLLSDNGKTITLDIFKGHNIVLYFYPKDDTPGCTIEAKDFTARAKNFEKANTVVIGVSKDSLESHCAFRTKYDLAVTLASDENGKTCEDYGVWVEKNMYGKKYMGIERTTLLIDGQGIIRKTWNKVKVDGHAEDVLAAAHELRA